MELFFLSISFKRFLIEFIGNFDAIGWKRKKSPTLPPGMEVG
jgi:hypothetical protein